MGGEMSEVRVYGNLEDRFKAIKGCPINYQDMIGKPIRDEDGRMIGVIKDVDLDAGMWDGIVFDHNDILKMLDDHERSASVEFNVQ